MLCCHFSMQGPWYTWCWRPLEHVNFHASADLIHGACSNTLKLQRIGAGSLNVYRNPKFLASSCLHHTEHKYSFCYTKALPYFLAHAVHGFFWGKVTKKMQQNTAYLTIVNLYWQQPKPLLLYYSLWWGLPTIVCHFLAKVKSEPPVSFLHSKKEEACSLSHPDSSFWWQFLWLPFLAKSVLLGTYPALFGNQEWAVRTRTRLV